MTGEYKKKFRVVFDNAHLDYSGGGEYVRMLITLFSVYTDVYVTRAPEFYNENPFASTLVKTIVRSYESDFVPELYILIDFNGYKKPIGIVNAQVCFYAIPKTTEGYDYAITFNRFVCESIERNWKSINSFIIEPFFNFENYGLGIKEKKIVNVGNFFKEKDGHSKNQDILLDWFVHSGLPEKGWVFECIGFVVNQDFFDFLNKKYKDNISVKLTPNASRDELLSSLRHSSYMLHGMGIGRVKAEQTEHFGLVIVQALLSGAQPIVHASGGAQNIPGVIVFKNLNEINEIISSTKLNGLELIDHGRHFSLQNALNQTLGFLDAIEKKYFIHGGSNFKKYNFGCGCRKLDNYINVDVDAACLPDLIINLENVPWPIDSDSVSEAVFDNSLQQMGAANIDFFNLINELYRVCCNGALVKINVPHFRSDKFYDDPLNVRKITHNTFKVLTSSNNYFDNSPSCQPLLFWNASSVDFEVLSTTVFPSKKYAHLLETASISQEDFLIAADEKNNVIDEIQILLRVKK